MDEKEKEKEKEKAARKAAGLAPAPEEPEEEGGDSPDSRASDYVRMHLLMQAPFAADNQVAFTLTPEAGGTRVSWAMEGNTTYLMKLISTVLNMDKMMAREFDAGLAALKQQVEA